MSLVNASASRIARSVTCEMFRSPIVTASVSGRRRAPLHTRHGISRMNCSMRSRAESESVSACRRSMLGIAPSYVVQYARWRPYRFLYRTWISSSEPYSKISRVAFGSFFHGVSRLKPCVSATASGTRYQDWGGGGAHGAGAPSLALRSGWGTTSSGSTSSRVPKPSHVWHAPYGELNEKFRGASSSNESPQYVHARFWEKVWTSS